MKNDSMSLNCSLGKKILPREHYENVVTLFWMKCSWCWVYRTLFSLFQTEMLLKTLLLLHRIRKIPMKSIDWNKQIKSICSPPRKWQHSRDISEIFYLEQKTSEMSQKCCNFLEGLRHSPLFSPFLCICHTFFLGNCKVGIHSENEKLAHWKMTLRDLKLLKCQINEIT